MSAEPVARPEPAPTPTPSTASGPARPPAGQLPPAIPAPPAPVREEFRISGKLEQGGWIKGLVPMGTVSARLGDEEIDFDVNGAFFAAFDRDEGPVAQLEATLASGKVVTRELAIKPRSWDIEHVNVALRPSTSSEAFRKRRAVELEAIWTSRQKDTDAQGWRKDFIWPVTGRISGRFGSQRIYRGEPGSYHSGLDIAGGAGTTYVAPADGTVVLAEQDYSLEGQLLIIDHGQGLNSAFLHSSALLVSEGQAVKQGQPLGRIGSSGRATGPHLHWSLVWKDKRLDPLLFLPPMP
nr:M23 family metallopeptidase [Qipengyuania sphaerica]